MNRLILFFQKNVNSITVFAYLLNIILVSLLYNNPFITITILISLLIISFLTRREKFFSYIGFSSVVFLVTVLFNLILNQRGTHNLLMIGFLKITTESLGNSLILGLSFVNLLWSFYIYDSFARTKVIFEVLSRLFKSIAIIFILTLKFIPEIIQTFTETRELRKFRVNIFETKGFKKIQQTIDLTEIILDKAVAKFMNVSDTLILKGYEKQHQRMGKIFFKRIDYWTLTLIVGSFILDFWFAVTKTGQINFGSANLMIGFNHKIFMIMIINSVLILLPLLIGGINYQWWKFYISKTTVSNTITAKSYR